MGWTPSDSPIIAPSTILEKVISGLVFVGCVLTAPISAPFIIYYGGFEINFLKLKSYGKWWGKVYGLFVLATFFIVVYPVLTSLCSTGSFSLNSDTLLYFLICYVLTDTFARKPF